MAVVAGGSKTNLVEAYAVGEDTGVDYGKARQVAQTFTLDEETVVFRFRLKSWTLQGDKFYHYALYATDGAGKPTGAPIATTILSPTGEYWYPPGGSVSSSPLTPPPQPIPGESAGARTITAVPGKKSPIPLVCLRCGDTRPRLSHHPSQLSQTGHLCS